jgi:hypothetical protein
MTDEQFEYLKNLGMVVGATAWTAVVFLLIIIAQLGKIVKALP